MAEIAYLTRPVRTDNSAGQCAVNMGFLGCPNQHDRVEYDCGVSEETWHGRHFLSTIGEAAAAWRAKRANDF